MDHLKRALHFIEASKNSQAAYPRAFYRKIADLIALADEVVEYLQREYGIKPLLVGGVAIQHYGYERQTTDLDILVSQHDYRRLMQNGEIDHGHLDFPGAFPIDVLCEGVDKKPNPETVRDGGSVYPTFEGLILLKLIAHRAKDEADIIELLKRRPIIFQISNVTAAQILEDAKEKCNL